MLALLLWRQKVLRLVDTVSDGAAETWQFVEPHGSETYSVSRPPLADEEIERLSTQLERLIGGEAESPAGQVGGGVESPSVALAGEIQGA